MEEDEYGPSCLWPAPFGREHANTTPTQVEILHLPDGERFRRPWDLLGIADRRIPWQFVHLCEICEVLVVECGVFWVESRNDCRVEDGGFYHGFNNPWTFQWGKGVSQIRPQPQVKLAYFTLASSRTNGPMFRTMQ